MILVDTSVWVDHFRGSDPELAGLLGAGRVLMHPFVKGELALGNLRARQTVLTDLSDLPQAKIAEDAEVLHLIGRDGLFGSGIGYVDAHLLASARLTIGASLWTHDKRLKAIAAQLDLAFTP